MLTTPLENLSDCFASFIYKDAGNKIIQTRDWNNTKEKIYIDKEVSYSKYDVEVCAMFSQTWSSTALGFSGIGGQAFTDAYTIILKADNIYCVYFGYTFAYKFERKNLNISKFYEDIAGRNMATVANSNIYKKII